METLFHIAAYIAVAAIAGLFLTLAVGMGFNAAKNLTWDSYDSKKWYGVGAHYFLHALCLFGSLVSASLAVALVVAAIVELG